MEKSWISGLKNGGLTTEEFKFFLGEKVGNGAEDKKTKDNILQLRAFLDKKIDYNRSVLPWCAFAYSRPTVNNRKLYTDARSILG